MQQPGGAHRSAGDEVHRLARGLLDQRRKLILGSQETVDAPNQPAQRLLVDALPPPEVEQDAWLRAARSESR